MRGDHIRRRSAFTGNQAPRYSPLPRQNSEAVHGHVTAPSRYATAEYYETGESHFLDALLCVEADGRL